MKYEEQRDFTFAEDGHKYIFNDGTECISTTTLLAEQGFGTDFKKLLETQGAKENIEKAGAKGTLVHKMIEDFIKGGMKDNFSLSLSDDAVFLFNSIKGVLEQKGLTLNDVRLKSELRLVEREPLPIGGSIDLLLNLSSGENIIIDFKTGTPQKEKEDWQVGIYAYLYKANTGLSVSEKYIINSRDKKITKAKDIEDKEIINLLTCAAEGKMYKDIVNEEKKSVLNDDVRELDARLGKLEEKETILRENAAVMAYLETIEEKEKCKKAIKDKWDLPYGTVETEYNKISYIMSNTLDSKKVKAEYPEVYEACLKESSRFTITPLSKEKQKGKESDKTEER